MDSSSVSAASRAETCATCVVGSVATSVVPAPDPKGKASTFCGCRCPHRPPAQYAPAIITTATTINRTAFDPFPALIFAILPRLRLIPTIPHAIFSRIAPKSPANFVGAGLAPPALHPYLYLDVPCGPLPQSPRQLPHLPPRLLQRPRTVNLLCSVFQLLPRRHLRRNSPPGLNFTQPPCQQSLHLLLGPTPSHHQPVQILLIPRLHQQSRLHKRRIRDATFLPLRKLPHHLLFHPRMHNRIQSFQFFRVCKHDRAQLSAIDPPVRPDYAISKVALNLFERRRPGLHHRMPQRIRINHPKSQLAQHTRHSALSAFNPPGNSQPLHPRPLPPTRRRPARRNRPRNRLCSPHPRRLHRVAHQHRYRHRAHAPRHRRQRPRHIHRIRVHIPHKRISLRPEFFQAGREVPE